MKTKLLPLALLTVFAWMGCTHNDNVLPDTPIPTSGTFTGQFKLYHVTAGGTTRVDSANLNLVMETATGYKITGDTTAVHAGSYGGYLINSGSFQILFSDKTFSASAPSTKVHLNGIYNYHYDGVNLQLLAYGPADTLQYFYTFKRTGN